MEKAYEGGSEEATAAVSVVDAAAPTGQAVRSRAQGNADEYSTGSVPDATGVLPPSSREYSAVVNGGSFDGLHQPPSIVRGRSSLSSISLNLLGLDSEHFIQWDPPPQQGEEEGSELVVLLGWLGAPQKNLRRYADLYRDRGFGLLRFVVPVRELVGLHFGRHFVRRVADLSDMIVSWCDADRRRTLFFHTFSHTGWLTYGLLLENLQSRVDITARIRGCIIDSAPVIEICPQVWAAGFSAAILKKSSSLARSSADSPDGSTFNGNLNKLSSASEPTRPSWGETFLQSTLRKIFEIVLNVPKVNQRLHKVLAILSEKQPSCPQFYLYSSADRVVPAECVESFISTQISLGLSVSAHNFMSSPHVDHYRSFPQVYSAKIDEFFEICSPSRAVPVQTVRPEGVGSTTLRDTCTI